MDEKINFKRRILKTNIASREETVKEEYQWLSQIKSEELGKRYYNFQRQEYNLSPKVGMTNRHHTEETRRKISESNMGKKMSQESINKGRQSRKGEKRAPYSEEHRKKISQAKKGKSNGREGCHHTKATKKKMSIAQRLKNSSL